MARTSFASGGVGDVGNLCILRWGSRIIWWCVHKNILTAATIVCKYGCLFKMQLERGKGGEYKHL